jgi:phosphoribosyl 1,2-cyclic phosphodiesterase
MSLNFTSLNSGSNGNCYYIGNEQDAVLIDAGISCRETVFRMTRLGIPITNVRAIFVSHEHSDHIRGVEFLSRKYRIPVYLSAVMVLTSIIQIEEPLLHTFGPNEKVDIAGLEVTAFQKLHDSSDPYSFTVSGKGYTVGVFTDIGEPCANVIHHFSRCHAAFLEANYDEDMLDNGNYPIYLKRRIKSNVGHLSNVQALELFKTHKAKHLSHLVLSHLSEHNNQPGIVRKLFIPHANGTRIEIASRYRESEVFSLPHP